jgi:hypothetical protein
MVGRTRKARTPDRRTLPYPSWLATGGGVRPTRGAVCGATSRNAWLQQVPRLSLRPSRPDRSILLLANTAWYLSQTSGLDFLFHRLPISDRQVHSSDALSDGRSGTLGVDHQAFVGLRASCCSRLFVLSWSWPSSMRTNLTRTPQRRAVAKSLDKKKKTSIS